MIAQRAPKQTKADETAARRLVERRDGSRCLRCGRYYDGLNFDHRVNRSQGGRWSASNGQMLCGSGTTGCHGWVTSHPELAIADGWAAPSYAVTTEWPARRWVNDELRWVTYDDDGHWAVISDDEAMRRMGRREIGIPVMGSGRRRSRLES
jgi:hypothetical protein